MYGISMIICKRSNQNRQIMHILSICGIMNGGNNAGGGEQSCNVVTYHFFFCVCACKLCLISLLEHRR